MRFRFFFLLLLFFDYFFLFLLLLLHLGQLEHQFQSHLILLLHRSPVILYHLPLLLLESPQYLLLLLVIILLQLAYLVPYFNLCIPFILFKLFSQLAHLLKLFKAGLRRRGRLCWLGWALLDDDLVEG